MYRSGRCFALSRTAPQAPSCRARVMRHQAAVTGDKGRVSSCYKICKARGRPASRRIPSPSGCLLRATSLSAVMTVSHAQQGLHARPQVAGLSPIKRQR